MTYTINLNPVAQATVNPNFRKDSYSLNEEQKKQYSKAVKRAKKPKTFWSARKPMNVPLNIPTLSDNRFTDISKVVTNLKDGFDPALFQLPLVVAIPGAAVRQACAKDPEFIDYWDIRVEGFCKINPGDGDKEFYLQVCDGRHRQVIWAAHINHPEFSDFAELDGTWECQVVFANNIETYEETVKAFEESHGLYLDINSKKIRKPTAENNLGAEIKKGDPEAIKNIARMQKIGFWVEGGKNGYGDTSGNGVKTKYALFRRDALKNPMINDKLLIQAATWIKLDTGFRTDLVYSSTLAAALALVQVVVPKLTAGNGLQSLFEAWFKNKISDNDNTELVSYWKELGGNQDNKYAESVALGMMIDFKSTRLKKAMKQGQQNKSAYYDVVLDDITAKLFPPKSPVINTADTELEIVEELEAV